MPTLDSYKDTAAREHAQKAVYVIYVEGDDDVAYLDLIYPNRGLYYEFKAASDVSPDPTIPVAGGCEGVIGRVKAERRRCGDDLLNPKILGMVDRDLYKKRLNWSSFLEADNSNFQSKIDEGVTVLRRWEIENYFADPSSLDFTLKRLRTRSGYLSISEEQICDHLLEICDNLLVICAGSIVLHENDKDDLPPGWGIPLSSPGATEAQVLQHLQSQGISDAGRKLESRLAEVRRFDCGSTVKGTRLRHMLRIVDGKRLLTHFESKLQIPQKQWRLLAGDCQTTGADMEDLAEFINSLVR
jgi:hypothetical protein